MPCRSLLQGTQREEASQVENQEGRGGTGFQEGRKECLSTHVNTMHKHWTIMSNYMIEAVIKILYIKF